MSTADLAKKKEKGGGEEVNLAFSSEVSDVDACYSRSKTSGPGPRTLHSRSSVLRGDLLGALGASVAVFLSHLQSSNPILQFATKSIIKQTHFLPSRPTHLPEPEMHVGFILILQFTVLG